MTLESKFDTGATAEPPYDAGQLPWGYGDDKIAALVRSPDAIYVYWEITDEAIAAARERLGAAGAHGWCNLRVYDTSGRAFDGTNANSYFDITVDRGARDQFLDLRRPGASFHVDIGIKSHEGYFQTIARSGSAELPRKGPSPDHALEWLTVTTDDAHPATQPYRSKHVPRPAPPPGPAHADVPGTDAPSHGAPAVAAREHVEERTWTWTHPAHFEVRWEGPWLSDGWRAEWKIRWLGARDGTASVSLENAPWIAGPFAEHMLDPTRFQIRLMGDGPIVLEEHQSGLEVMGPWEIAIKGFDPLQRRTLGAWRVHWIRVEPAKVETWWAAFERVRVNAWERTRTLVGGSEARMIVEGGASELWRLGASERWSIGASEWLALGASELAWLGGSERVLGGASGALFGGASAVLFAASSQGMFGGASPSFWSGHPTSPAPTSPHGWR